MGHSPAGQAAHGDGPVTGQVQVDSNFVQEIAPAWRQRTFKFRLRRAGPGRVEMWRGGFSSIGCGRCSGWRRHPCDRTFTPFPHPAQRTGRADFPHPALGQDTCLRTRKVIRKSLIYNGERGSPQYPDQAINRSLQMPPLRRSFALRVNSDSYFTSASATFCSARSLAELTRVAPISRALPRSVPVLT